MTNIIKAEVKIIKVKNEKPTVIEIDGLRYVLDMKKKGK